MSASRGGGSGRGGGKKGGPSKNAGGKPTPGTSKAIVPRGQQAVVPRGQQQAMVPAGQQADNRIIFPKGYTARPVVPAKNYDVISFARAMNDDMGGRVQKLFEPEKEAAFDAIRTGVYIGWRCPEFTWDCQRVNRISKCFCGHMLENHAPYNAKSVRVPCKVCPCKGFCWVPTRPEEVGEFWFQRRRNFDPSTWRAKCKCKHTHEEHDPTGFHRCRSCGCGAFDSAFLCAACDKHWEHHETFFESAAERKEKGLPVGDDYLPFAEIPSLRNMVLTGEDDGDMSYMRELHPPGYELPPPPNAPADNSSVVPFGRGGGSGGSRGGGSRGGGASGFRPIYD